MNKEITIAIPADPNDPEDFDVSEAAMERALAERAARRGRPTGWTKENAKQQVSLRLDPDVIEGFKAGGPGWQSRMNQALRASLGR